MNGRPLRCYRCDAAGRTDYRVTADGAQQMLLVKGKKRLHANVRCSNGHEWWSRHKRAIEMSREVDAKAKGGG